MENNLKELVKLLDSLKKAYIRELDNNNLEKAEQIKQQIPRIIEEIKSIKEEGKLRGETVNINNLNREFQTKIGNDFNEENIKQNLHLNDVENEYSEIDEDYYDDETDEAYYDDETDEAYYDDETDEAYYDDETDETYYDDETDEAYYDDDVEEEKSLKQIKKELEKEKKKLKKIAKKKQKEDRREKKKLENEEKYTKSNLKEKEKLEKKKNRKAYWTERKERKDSQLKEAKNGTIFIFILIFFLILISISRSYIYTTAYRNEVGAMSTIHYIAMYNFLIRLYIIIVVVITLIFTFFQKNLKNVKLIRIFTILSGVLLYISFGGIPAKILYLRGDQYFLIPGICAIILLDLIGKSIVRDKIHYDYDYDYN